MIRDREEMVTSRKVQTPAGEPGEGLQRYITAANCLRRGEYDLGQRLGAANGDPFDPLDQALIDLGHDLARERREWALIDRITARINAGLLLEDILEILYEDLREIIPYNRIGLALVEDDGQLVRSYWARSDGAIQLEDGYTAPLAGSSLEAIVASGQPRILNDLEEYLRQKPSSQSTHLVVAEGVRSSLTCPLIVDGVPVGFLFFSSFQPQTYDDAHVDFFQRIAQQIAVSVEKGRLVSDLSAQKEAIERQNAELLRLDELKNTFLGIAAHDLRSPLSLIEMAVDFLIDPKIDPSPAERDMILRDVQQQTRYMLALIEDVLDITQIESGKLELSIEPVPLPAFLAETVARHDKMAASKSTRVLLANFPEGTLKADHRRLRQVLDNLISNAVKFSPGGSTVSVAAEHNGGEWVISVQDGGPGITAEDRKRLFQEFSRLSARPTGGEHSTGLGLAITRRVIEAHGGRIDVNSVPGQGATFWFALPD